MLEGADEGLKVLPGARPLARPLLQQCEVLVEFVLQQAERARISVDLDAEKR